MRKRFEFYRLVLGIRMDLRKGGQRVAVVGPAFMFFKHELKRVWYAIEDTVF